MDISALAELSKWMEQTDLEEIILRHGKDKITLKTGNSEEEQKIPESPLRSVSSPSVGIFRFAKPGMSASLRQGSKISNGSILGWIETGRSWEPVKSACDGFIRIIAIRDGQPAEYGQPLFFIKTEE